MTSWDEVRHELVRALVDLAPEHFLVVGEPEPPPGEPRGLLRRRPAPPPTRYVQFRRDGEEWLYAECVGTAPMGGDWPAEPDVHDRLRALGWLLPDEDDGSGMAPGLPNYWRLLPHGQAAEVAALGASSLEVLGVDPGTLEWRGGS